MDRNKMRALVFEDPLAKKRLEAIIHPKILGQIESQLSLAAEQGCKTVLIDIPLLAESHARWQTRLNGVLVVDCLVQTQVKRVMERSALEEATVLKIIASQAPRDVRNALANWIIFNEGLTLDELESKVLAIDFKI
jgi:dephospho-CoA kinase